MDRGIEAVTLVKNHGTWRSRCEEQWSAWPLSAVTRTEAERWVTQLKKSTLKRYRGKSVENGTDVPLLGAATIADCVHLMSKLFTMALKNDPPLVFSNPFSELELPTIKPAPSSTTSQKR